MKKFACGDVVPGCDATFSGGSVDDILGQVAGHARHAHGVQTVSAELADAVRSHIH